MCMVKLKNVTVQFDENKVLDCFSLTVKNGEHIVLMGPSGSGKTTVLKLIAGILIPDSGTVDINAQKISYMFQEPRLLPWLNAEENVNLVLGDKTETLPVARQWLERVGLDDAAKKYPSELSGGMKQRVSLARALAYDGELLLLDEPLSALDEATAQNMLTLVKEYAAKKTVILVTHNASHAKSISGRIIVIENA